MRAAFVGGLWGVGHTAALIVVGAAVLVLRIAIPERVATWLEFGVALMIIGLGLAALRKALRSRTDFHIHKHAHGGEFHAHAHFHEHGSEHADLPVAHSHAVTRMGFKPALVGAAHGLAGSGASDLIGANTNRFSGPGYSLSRRFRSGFDSRYALDVRSGGTTIRNWFSKA